MFISHASDDIRQDRDMMLQDSLRDFPTTYSICEEYPLILANEHYEKSLCMFLHDSIKDKVIAHANYLPRQVVDGNQVVAQVALIGNVATRRDFRNRGLMRDLLKHLEDVCVEKDMDALILWSDLKDFYSKLGYNEFGEELKFLFGRKKHFYNEKHVFRISQDDLNQDLVNIFSALRLSFVSIKRSYDEFKTFLSIPETVLLVHHEGARIRGYVIFGKGKDMVNVVHEWGAENPQIILSLCSFILERCELEFLTMLGPGAMPAHWRKTLSEGCDQVIPQPIGWVKILKPRFAEVLDKMYVWGLDSI